MTEAELTKTLCCGPPAQVVAAMLGMPAYATKASAEVMQTIGLCKGASCAAFRSKGESAWCGLAGKPD